MNTYHQSTYQIVFSTLGRSPWITPCHEKQLYRYIASILMNKKCYAYNVGGFDDHIHIITDLSPSVSLSDLVREVKKSSSIWAKESKLFPAYNGWSSGYAAFTYSIEARSNLIQYVSNQRIHHSGYDLLSEMKHLLNENGVEFEEKYLI